MELKHQHIVHRVNSEVAVGMTVESEGIELYYMMLVVFCILMFGIFIESQVDDRTLSLKLNEKRFVECMMGKTVVADGKLMKCVFENRKLVGEK